MSTRISSALAPFSSVRPEPVEGRKPQKTAFDRLRPNGIWLFPLFLLAACGQPQGNQQAPTAESSQAAATPENRIPCAPEGTADFTATCTIERTGDTFTVRNPDGGFHRLVISADDYGVLAADGAEPAKVHALEKQGKTTFEVSIGGDRYQLSGRIEGRLPDAS